MHGPRPPHSILFRVRICLFPPSESTPYLRTDKISEPLFRGLFAGFSCLGDPPKSKTLLNVPPIILFNFFYNPLFKFLRRPKRERKKNHPLFKRNLRVKSRIPPFFYNSQAGLCRMKSTPLPEILGTRMRSLRPRSGPYIKFSACDTVADLEGVQQASPQKNLMEYVF